MPKIELTAQEKETEKARIIAHLESSKTLEEARKKCGFSINTLYNRMEEYGIEHNFVRSKRKMANP